MLNLLGSLFSILGSSNGLLCLLLRLRLLLFGNVIVSLCKLNFLLGLFLGLWINVRSLLFFSLDLGVLFVSLLLGLLVSLVKLVQLLFIGCLCFSVLLGQSSFSLRDIFFCSFSSG